MLLDQHRTIPCCSASYQHRTDLLNSEIVKNEKCERITTLGHNKTKKGGGHSCQQSFQIIGMLNVHLRKFKVTTCS
jgi:uncharacterized membrane protein